MKYILRYETISKYLHYVRLQQKEFEYKKELRDFLLHNIDHIRNFYIYELTDLS